MTYAQYQESFERNSLQEKTHFDLMSVTELLTAVQAGQFGQYYQIWYSIGERATPSEVNTLFMSFLSSDAEYLHRYHCAAALIAVNGLKSEGWKPHDLSAIPTFPVAENLEKIRTKLFP